MENELGSKINRLRLEKGMTLEQVGNIVGVGKSTVRKWEQGTIANMGRDKIERIATALGTTPAFLMGWNEKTEMENSPNETKLTEGEELLLQLFRQVPEEQQELVLQMIQVALNRKG